MTDVGVELVEHLFREMQIDEEWAVRRDRGFTWWAGALAQRVWAEPAFDDLGVELSRVHVQTDVLQGVRGDPSQFERLGATTGFATMNGLLLGEGVVRLAASIFVHEGTLEMWKHLLTVAALLQVIEAHMSAGAMAELVGAAPAVSEHPISGLRVIQDDMLNVIRDAFAPLGERPSMFVGGDFESAERAFGRQHSVLTTASSSGLTSELPFGPETALVEMRTDVENPRLGNGLMVLLSLPLSFAAESRFRIALDLNRRELGEMTRTPFLGSWCPHPTQNRTLTHVSFFPNACALPGLPVTLLQYTASRAKWAESVFLSDKQVPARRPKSVIERLFRR